MREVKLSQGKVALVNDEDYAAISQFKWSAQRYKDMLYAVRHIYLLDGTRTHQGMHVFIMKPPPGLWVDHKDHNGLRNIRENLRIATPSQNSANRRKKEGCSSRFKGVTFLKRTKKWSAQAARERFGEFALCNFQK
jgi:hypothetical protein